MNKYLENYTFEQTKETSCQSAEPTTEKEQPIEETKETPVVCRTYNRKRTTYRRNKRNPCQSAEPTTEQEQPVEQQKKLSQSAEPTTEKEQPIEETKETPSQEEEIGKTLKRVKIIMEHNFKTISDSIINNVSLPPPSQIGSLVRVGLTFEAKGINALWGDLRDKNENTMKVVQAEVGVSDTYTDAI